MANENLTITRALTELKNLDSRISTKTGKLLVVDVQQQKYGNKALNSKLTTEEFNAKAKAEFDSVQDLIKRRAALKSAIVSSNASTTVNIGGVEMPVAAAIEMKSSIALKQALLKQLKAQKLNIDNVIERNRLSMEQQIEQLVQQNTGKDRRIDSEDYNRIAAPFIAANEAKMVDAVNIQTQIDTLEAEIESFITNVDVALSESNARTEIELKY